MYDSFFPAYTYLDNNNLPNCRGSTNCCSNDKTNDKGVECGLGQGDCDATSDCRGSLKCGNENCKKYPLLGMTTSYFGNDLLNSGDCCNF